ncbi:hypothetical protein [Ruegeria marina]|uniref:Uncharacterized protein n=1 Tax=Ruegeria marina TaxID=639004 RepID=A0A1G6N7P5_9RHOB|nr:hypothetical protein [Ruegeria marina]SDC63813.1 hypothetical protein SAMN04488239_10359 [Ruegeria marina]
MGKRLCFHPVFWGVLATLAVLSLALWIGFQADCDSEGVCQTKFSTFLAARPNEIGDTLAGFAGALAFVWIIVTVWLQSQELGEQRKELELTRKEFQKMAEAQDSQVEILKSQNKVLVEEQRLRIEQYWGAEAGKLKKVLKDAVIEVLGGRQEVLFGVGESTELVLLNHAQKKYSRGRDIIESDVHDLLSNLESALNSLVDGEAIKPPIRCKALESMYSVLCQHRDALGRASKSTQLEGRLEQLTKLIDSIGRKLDPAP